MTIGVKLRNLRIEKGYTQKDLAKVLHVSDKTVSKWERGKSVPDIEMLNTLSEHFNVSMQTFFENSALEKNENHALEERLKRLMWIAATLLVPLMLFFPVGYLIEGIIRSESVLQEVLIVPWILFVGLSTLSAMVLIGYSYLTVWNHHDALDIKTMYRALHALLVFLTLGVLISDMMFKRLLLHYFTILWTIGIATLMYLMIRLTKLDFNKGKGFKVTVGILVFALFIYLTTPRGMVAPFTKTQAFFVLSFTVFILFLWVEEKTLK
ncbi:MAG: helix-turn-helix domain-containing protein, partial [Bacillota bacterium]